MNCPSSYLCLGLISVLSIGCSSKLETEYRNDDTSTSASVSAILTSLQEFVDASAEDFMDKAKAEIASSTSVSLSAPVPSSLEIDGLSITDGFTNTANSITSDQFSYPEEGELALSGHPRLGFGTVQVGRPSRVNIRLVNVGRKALMLLTLEANRAKPALRPVGNNCPRILPPFEECEVTLEYAPTAPEIIEENLRFVYLKSSGKVSASYRSFDAQAKNPIRAISAGGNHSCGLKDGRAYCWGYNGYGGLGDGSASSRNIPTAVVGIEGATAIATSSLSSCAIADGGVKCWGYNGYGELGDGSYTTRSLEANVSGLSSGVTQISMHANHACAVQNGGAKCWGRGDYHQLGTGVAVSSNVAQNVVGLESNVAQVATGTFHSCALMKDGKVKCWGYNGYGQLGNNTNVSSGAPVDVVGLESKKVVSLALGHSHSCALTSDKQTYCWGYNGYGQLGDGSVAPKNVATKVFGLGAASSIAAGEYHTCAISGDRAYCWGYNGNGEIGNGSTAGAVLAPNEVVDSIGIRSIDAGVNHTCGDMDGAYACWGYNAYGQIGNQTNTSSTLAEEIYPVNGFQ